MEIAQTAHRVRAAGRHGGEAEVVDGLQSVDAAAWDRMVPAGSGALCRGFLLAWERCELPGLRSRPIVVRATGRAVPELAAAAAAYRYDLDLAAVHRLPAAALITGVRRLWPGLLRAGVLELGAPVPAVAPLLTSPGVDQAAAAAAILDAAVREASATGATFTIVQDLVEPAGPLAGALRARGFVELQSLPTAVLENRWTSFEAYLGAMRSRYRSRAVQILGRSEHLAVDDLDDFASLADEFSVLWRHVYDRATETRREILTPAYFEAVAELRQTRTVVLRRRDRSIAAFGLLLDDPPWLHFLQTGFTADAGRDEAAYFRLLLEVVRTGIDRGSAFVHLGCTALGPKLMVGAEPLPLYSWVRHRNPLLNACLRVFARRLSGAGTGEETGRPKVFAERR